MESGHGVFGPVSTDPNSLIGMTVAGRYRIERKIGQGAIGRVYRAIQLPLERPVAIKFLSAEFQERDPNFGKRFLLEAAATAKLAHPNTVTVFDYGEAEDGQLYIVMEYLRGATLQDRIEKKSGLPITEVLQVAMQVASALRDAHAKGIVHCDLTPANIFLMDDGDDPGFVKVLDFGLARILRAIKDSDTDPNVLPLFVPNSDTEHFLGSPGYMAPEQIQGRGLDPRADIYALGATMFEMVTGRRAFVGDSSMDIIQKQLTEDPPSVFSYSDDQDLSHDLGDIIQKCMMRAPEARYSSMNEVLEKLRSMDRSAVRKIREAHGQHAFEDSILQASDHSEIQRMPKRMVVRTLFAAMLIIGAAFVATYLLLAQLRAGKEDVQPMPPSGSDESVSEVLNVIPESRLSVLSDPPGASVYEGTKLLGKTPFQLVSLERENGQPRHLSFRMDGFIEQTRVVVPDAVDAPIHVQLVPSKPTLNGRPPREYKDNPY
jgi:hypothetical protein